MVWSSNCCCCGNSFFIRSECFLVLPPRVERQTGKLYCTVSSWTSNQKDWTFFASKHFYLETKNNKISNIEISMLGLFLIAVGNFSYRRNSFIFTFMSTLYCVSLFGIFLIAFGNFSYRKNSFMLTIMSTLYCVLPIFNIFPSRLC